MLHHVSIPARNPAHVAAVLGELLGGYSGPFIGPIPGAHVAYAEDEPGTGIEVYPEDTLIVPGDGEQMGQAIRGEAPRWSALHVLVSVKVDRATIERIGTREGWRTKHYWRGPGEMKLFELYEFWVENRIMLELVTPDMVPAYAAIARGRVQRELLAKMAAAGTPG